MEVVKTLIHSVISDRRTSECIYINLDIKDFYITNPLDRPEYIRILRKHLSDEVIAARDLEKYIVNEAMLCEINMCMACLRRESYQRGV